MATSFLWAKPPNDDPKSGTKVMMTRRTHMWNKQNSTRQQWHKILTVEVMYAIRMLEARDMAP
jgi:hypothetical protein